MRRLRFALSIAVLVVVVATSSRWAATAPEPKPTFRVATWNIHKGADRRGNYHLHHTIDAIASFDADLVGLQEVMRNQPESNCDDQPALIAEGLRRRTGRPWTHVHVKAWISDKRYCQERGRGDGIETEGLAFFAAEPIAVSRSTRLPESRVAVEVRLASLPHVPVIVTHLAPNREGQALRVRQFAALVGVEERLKLLCLMTVADIGAVSPETLTPWREELLWRHPFPGPGLAVRILGEVTEERLRVVREADARVEEEIRRAGLYRALWQAFAVLLPVHTVGVMGDERTYEQVIALRAVTSQDAMTADWAKLPADVLERISNRIINEVKGVNRVVYDISSKPPATIEWE